MGKKLTKAALEGMVEELLNLRLVVERYEYLQGRVKYGMVALDEKEIEVAGSGRVFVAQSERVVVSPGLARDVLGDELAEKLIRVKESVPNALINAFAEVGDLSEGQHEALLQGAEKTPVVNLYVRPLK